MSAEPFLRIALIIIDVDPGIVTGRLGLEPTDSRRKGDMLLNGHVVRGGWWSIERSLYLASDRDVESEVEVLLGALQPCWEELRKLSAEYRVQLALALNFDPEHTPGLCLGREVLSRLASLNASLDVSLYPGND